MEQEKMLSELIQNRCKNVDKLRELLETYDLADASDKMQEQRVREIYNRVLRENEFFAVQDSLCSNIKIGDRITNEKQDFLMSEEDFERMLDLAQPILFAEKITDEKGYCINDWASKRNKTWVELVNFIIQKILPAPFRETFWENRFNVPKMDKLIESVRKIA